MSIKNNQEPESSRLTLAEIRAQLSKFPGYQIAEEGQFFNCANCKDRREECLKDGINSPSCRRTKES